MHRNPQPTYDTAIPNAHHIEPLPRSQSNKPTFRPRVATTKGPRDSTQWIRVMQRHSLVPRR